MSSFNDKELELRKNLEKSTNLEENKRAIKQYLQFLITCLKNKTISEKQFDSFSFYIIMYSKGENENDLINSIWICCSELDVSDEDPTYWTNRNRTTTREELINYVSKL